MSDTALILWTHVVIMITSLIGLAASVIGLFVAWENSRGIKQIRVELNGQLRRMIEIERELAHADGFRAGKASSAS